MHEDTPPHSLEMETGNPMTQPLELTGKTVSPSLPPGFTPVVMKQVSFADVVAGKEKPGKLLVKNLASVFTAAVSKETKNSVFIKVMFPVDPNPKDPVKAARSQLVEYFKMIQSVDKSAALLKWGKDTGATSESCTKLSDLPATLTGGLTVFCRPVPSDTGWWKHLV